MAKAAIRKLKDERFWRWLCVEVYGKPAPKKPIKRCRKRRRMNWRKIDQRVTWILKTAAKHQAGRENSNGQR